MGKALAILAVATEVLVAAGLVVLASAGVTKAEIVTRNAAGGPNPYFFVQRQAIWLAIAFVLALAAGWFDYRKWRSVKWLAPAFFAVTSVLLAVTVLPKMFTSLEVPLRPLTRSINGSYRWLDFGPIRLQPGELAKLAVVICLSVWLDKIGNRVQSLVKGVLYTASIIVPTLALLVLEPDFGSAMVVCVLSFALMFYSGVRFLHLAGLGLSISLPIMCMIALNDNRRQRLLAWLAGNENGGLEAKTQSVYQLKQAMCAIGNGGLSGRGFGESMQRYGYLPEAHTDFIFAIGAEEWGMWFSIGTIALFAVWTAAGVYIATRAADRLGRLLAFGMTYLVGFQAAFNISVVCGTVPTKGLALPFMSYGGTNLMTALIATAIIFNVGLRSARQSAAARNAATFTRL